LFIEIGKKQISNETIRQDLEKMEQILNKAQKPTNLVVDIQQIPLSSAMQLPSILMSVVSFSGRNKELIEKKICCAYLVSQNQIGKTFIEMLLQRRQSQVPVRICSTLDEIDLSTDSD
jgi:hypothetical protein